MKERLVIIMSVCLHGTGSKRIQMYPVRKSGRIGLLFTRDRSGTCPERIENCTFPLADPIFDPLRTGSRTVPCKQKPIRSGSVLNGSCPVPFVPQKRLNFDKERTRESGENRAYSAWRIHCMAKTSASYP